MIGPTQRIRQLRGCNLLEMHRHTPDQFRVIVPEKDGSESSYHFSVPIYDRTGSAISTDFTTFTGGFSHTGSNSTSEISPSGITITADFGTVKLSFPQKTEFFHDPGRLSGPEMDIYPTFNGVAVRIKRIPEGGIVFRMTSSVPGLNYRAKNSVFSLMKFINCPFCTLSAIAVTDEKGTPVAPAEFGYIPEGPDSWQIYFPHCGYPGAVFELNAQDDKLIRDTTVETAHPDDNNAFGSAAYIGQTEAFGEQWLYSCPDISRVILDKKLKISKATLHVPKICGSASVASFTLRNRFCSFGSSWNNRAPFLTRGSAMIMSENFLSTEITHLFVDDSGRPEIPAGIVLRPHGSSKSFSGIFTADSFLSPQIIEINYKPE